MLAVSTVAAQGREGERASSSPSRVAGLLQELQSPDLQKRRDAARKLAAIKPLPPAAIPAMVRALHDPDPMLIVQRCSTAALGNAGAPATGAWDSRTPRNNCNSRIGAGASR
jgi:HEAT repeat protein